MHRLDALTPVYSAMIFSPLFTLQFNISSPRADLELGTATSSSINLKADVRLLCTGGNKGQS